MIENQFLQQLKEALVQLPVEEQQDILQDIREYFANGRSDGKSDSEIADELGSPLAIAKELTDTFDFANIKTHFNKEKLAKDEFDKVDIQVENGTLITFPSADGKMYVDVEDKSYKQQLDVHVLNRVLVITLKEEPKKWGIFNFTINLKSPTITVQLPKKIYDSIKVESENGNITAENLESKILLADSDNGSIKLENLIVADLTAQSDNGTIELKSIQATTLNVSADNGSIIIKEAEGNVRAEADNGSIDLLVADLERTISLETDNGSIFLETLSKPQNTTILADAEWGSVSVFGEKHAKTIFGNGQHLVELQADNGRIKVREAQTK